MNSDHELDAPDKGPDTADARQHSIIANGIRINYRLIGSGPQVVVCLHGFPQTSRSWERLAGRLGSQYTIIAPDLRGTGDTQRPPTGYDKKTMAADVHELVAALGFDRTRLVGHDIGAAVAFAYAAQWPQEVTQLVMIEMLLPGFGLEELYAIRKPDEFAHMPFFMTPDLPEWLIAGHEGEFVDWFIRNMVADQAAFTPDDISAYAQACARPGGLRAGFDAYRAFWQDAEDNRRFAVTKLKMPVLAIGAELSIADGLFKSMQPLVENLRGLVFERCGHFIPDEQPGQLALELETFFKEHPSAPDTLAEGDNP